MKITLDEARQLTEFIKKMCNLSLEDLVQYQGWRPVTARWNEILNSTEIDIAQVIAGEK
jgi:hypothetical protein